MILRITGNKFANTSCQKVADNLNKNFNYHFKGKRYNTNEL